MSASSLFKGADTCLVSKLFLKCRLFLSGSTRMQNLQKIYNEIVEFSFECLNLCNIRCIMGIIINVTIG